MKGQHFTPSSMQIDIRDDSAPYPPLVREPWAAILGGSVRSTNRACSRMQRQLHYLEMTALSLPALHGPIRHSKNHVPRQRYWRYGCKRVHDSTKRPPSGAPAHPRDP